MGGCTKINGRDEERKWQNARRDKEWGGRQVTGWLVEEVKWDKTAEKYKKGKEHSNMDSAEVMVHQEHEGKVSQYGKVDTGGRKSKIGWQAPPSLVPKFTDL